MSTFPSLLQDYPDWLNPNEVTRISVMSRYGMSFPAKVPSEVIKRKREEKGKGLSRGKSVMAASSGLALFILRLDL